MISLVITPETESGNTKGIIITPDIYKRQMAIENTVSRDFDPRSSIVKSVFYCRLSGVIMNKQGLAGR